VLIGNRHPHSGPITLEATAIHPKWFGKALLIETNGKCRRIKFNAVAKAERTFKPNPSESDCVERALVRVAKPAQ
jgi:hypothetical protein